MPVPAALVDVGSLTKVLVASLLAGAGLVAVFALGIVGVSTYLGQQPIGTQADGAASKRRPLGLVLAVICFAVVVAGVAYGLYVMLNK